MGKIFRMYMPFLNSGAKARVSYPANFILGLVGSILACFISFFLWQAIFNSSDQSSFMGFTMSDMVLYVFLSFLTGYLTRSNATNVVGEEIRDGTIAMRMIRPTSYTMTTLFEGIGSKLINLGLIFPPIILGVEIYRTLSYGAMQFRMDNFLLYLVSAILAFLINFYFSICIGFTAIIFTNLWGVNVLVGNVVGFLSGAVIPLAFFPSVIENILLILPFASLSYTPVMIYMGMYKDMALWKNLGLQVFWLLFFYGLSKLIFSIVIKRLNIQGG